MHILSGGFGEYTAYGLALLAALANAAGQILQRKPSREEPEEAQESARLFLDLARKPLWLAGIAFVVLGSVFQIGALNFGALATVQTLVILELPFTLIGASWFLDSKLRWRDWLYIAVMTAGTAGVVAFLNPRGGHAANINPLTWGVAVGATTLPIIVLYYFTRRGESARDAALLGAATGVCFALFAALMKGVTLQFHQGFIPVITSWQIYLAIIAAVAGMWLLQNAVHAGKLVAAQPGITLLDPAVSIVWGALVFDERMRGGLYILLAMISAAAIAFSAFGLAASPRVEEEESQSGG
ncbi:MAG TPA: DMT family transporter [Gammaproteobacteria bacterium]|nr:DMT family transporter [Gammaproteobacteria bacterium]